ncbi:MAG: hypothetical protein MJ166_01670 [Clostridia bacterium]|nr:hypothetical protein [Clostridia bacterium]
MITFITALYEEAKSIINTYKMKKRLDETFFQYFASSEAELIITGSGYSNAYKAVTRHFSLREPSIDDIVINVGICGASSDYSVGELYYINRINDCVFDRTYYPDLLYKSSFRQTAVSSFNKVVTNTDEVSGLVDMEAGAIYDALSAYFSPDRVFFFKVVSDITSANTDFSRVDIDGLVSSNLEAIVDFAMPISDFLCGYNSNVIVFEGVEEELISSLQEALSMTQSMKDLFSRLLKYRKLNSQDIVGVLTNYKNLTIDLISKSDKKKVFNELKNDLLSFDMPSRVETTSYYPILNSGFTNVYVEEGIDLEGLEFPLDLSKRNIIRIDQYKDIFNRSKQNIELQKLTQALILTTNKGKFVYEGAKVCQSFGNKHFYYCSTIMNCVFNCDYCFLGGMYPSGFITVYANLDNAFEEIEEILKLHSVYLCITYDSDLLAFENLLGYVKRFIDFTNKHENLVIEIRSKFGNSKLIEKFEPSDRVIFAWTFSPDSIAQIAEKKASPLNARINALKKAQELGYKTRVCIDPIIYSYDWENEYKNMIDSIFDVVDKDKVLDASIGVFRISAEYLKALRKRKPNSPTVNYPFVIENNVAHYGGTSKLMVNTIKSKLEEYIDTDKIYVWDGTSEN